MMTPQDKKIISNAKKTVLKTGNTVFVYHDEDEGNLSFSQGINLSNDGNYLLKFNPDWTNGILKVKTVHP
jgi:hypothetical protein